MPVQDGRISRIFDFSKRQSLNFVCTDVNIVQKFLLIGGKVLGSSNKMD